MTDFLGTWLVKPKLGSQDVQVRAVGRIAWTGGALANTDTLNIAGLIPFGERAIIDSVRVFGTNPDSNATPAFAMQIGVTGDTDAFLGSTVVSRGVQFALNGIGEFVAGAPLEGDKALILTVTASPTTGVTSGTVFVEVVLRQRN